MGNILVKWSDWVDSLFWLFGIYFLAWNVVFPQWEIWFDKKFWNNLIFSQVQCADLVLSLLISSAFSDEQIGWSKRFQKQIMFFNQSVPGWNKVWGDWFFVVIFFYQSIAVWKMLSFEIFLNHHFLFRILWINIWDVYRKISWYSL